MDDDLMFVCFNKADLNLEVPLACLNTFKS